MIRRLRILEVGGNDKPKIYSNKFNILCLLAYDHVADALPSCDSVPSLPPSAMAAPVFVWGSVDGPSCISSINACYEEAVHWRPNLPSGRVGERVELSCLFNEYATA